LNPIIQQFFNYLKKPHAFFNEQLTSKEKWKTVGWILGLDILLVFASITIIGLINLIIPLEQDNFDELLYNRSPLEIFLLVALLAPIVEETIFRFFLKYKRNYLFRAIDSLSNTQIAKQFWITYFHFFFYCTALVFAIVHIGNYSNTGILFYIMAPLLVIPQFIIGISLGYIRLKLGFVWSILLHGLYNFTVMAPMIFFVGNTVITSQNTATLHLNIEAIEMGLAKPSSINIYKTDESTDSIIIKNSKVSTLALQLFPTDSSLIKNNRRINLRFINHAKEMDAHLIIAKELKEYYKKD